MADISDVPEVFYENPSKISDEEIKELYPELTQKSRGIRVFYFNQTITCDHPQHHSSRWEDSLGCNSLEAGTTIALTQYSVNGDGKQRYLLIIRWDCGFEKAYNESELENIRVFDLGPAGTYIVRMYIVLAIVMHGPVGCIALGHSE